MKKNNLTTTLFAIFITTIIIFLFIELSSINSGKQKENKAKNFNRSSKSLTPTIDAINLISYMFFSYKLESIAENRKILTIYLKGSEDSLADAADFKIEFDNNIIIEKIIDGDSFIFYPRKIIKNNSVLITGVSLNEENNLKFAKPNTTFIKIILQTKYPEKYKKPLLINLNKSESKIFFSGKDITNLNQQFEKITLN